MDFGDYTDEPDDLIDNYFCKYLNMFFDEMTEKDMDICPFPWCENCKYYGKIDQLRRMIKIKDGEVILLNMR